MVLVAKGKNLYTVRVVHKSDLKCRHSLSVVASSDLNGLCELLVDMAGDWELLLSAIGVRGDKRKQLRLQHQDPKLCLVEGLEQWLVTTDTPTYGTIIGALRGKIATNFPLSIQVEDFVRQKSALPTSMLVN